MVLRTQRHGTRAGPRSDSEAEALHEQMCGPSRRREPEIGKTKRVSLEDIMRHAERAYDDIVARHIENRHADARKGSTSNKRPRNDVSWGAEICSLIDRCTRHSPAERPPFGDVARILKQLYEDSSKGAKEEINASAIQSE